MVKLSVIRINSVLLNVEYKWSFNLSVENKLYIKLICLVI